MEQSTIQDAVPSVDPGRLEVASKPRHRHVFDTLLGEINAGRFRPGDRIPTEAELAKTFSASRTTISRAMRELKGRGLIDRQRGGGTRVSAGATPAAVAQPAVAPPDRLRLAYFAPFAPSAANLGFIDSQVYTHLADLTARRGDDMRLQLIGHRGQTQLEQMLSAVDELTERGTDGVFYVPIELPPDRSHFNCLVVEKMRAAGLAVLLVDRDVVLAPHRSDLSLVTFDNRRGGHLLTAHLIARGCRRIAFVTTPYESSAASDRLRGHIDALMDADLPVDRSFIRKADLWDLDAGFCRSLVEQVRPDAIVCKQDMYAAMVGHHLIAMGMRIGQDVLLAGFDDQPIAGVLPVPLTSVHFPIGSLTRLAHAALLREIDQRQARVTSVMLVDVDLVVRPSTAGRCDNRG